MQTAPRGIWAVVWRVLAKMQLLTIAFLQLLVGYGEGTRPRGKTPPVISFRAGLRGAGFVQNLFARSVAFRNLGNPGGEMFADIAHVVAHRFFRRRRVAFDKRIVKKVVFLVRFGDAAAAG